MDKRTVHWQEVFSLTPTSFSDEFEVNVYYRHGWYRRIEVFRKLLNSYMVKGELEKNVRVADLGCGSGKYARIMQQQGLNTTALDLNFEMLKFATEKQVSDVSYVNGDCCRLPYNDKFFDFIISFGVISIITNPVPFYLELKRIAAPNSKIMLMTLNYWYPTFFIEELFPKWKSLDKETCIISYSPFQLKRHLQEFFPDSKIEMEPIYIFPVLLSFLEPIFQKFSFLHKWTFFLAKSFIIIIQNRAK